MKAILFTIFVLILSAGIASAQSSTILTPMPGGGYRMQPANQRPTLITPMPGGGFRTYPPNGGGHLITPMPGGAVRIQPTRPFGY